MNWPLVIILAIFLLWLFKDDIIAKKFPHDKDPDQTPDPDSINDIDYWNN
jgi:hypothetical protein